MNWAGRNGCGLRQGHHPFHPFAQTSIPHDAVAYKDRNRVVRCFTTRYDRRTIHSIAFIHIAATMIWLR